MSIARKARGGLDTNFGADNETEHDMKIASQHHHSKHPKTQELHAGCDLNENFVAWLRLHFVNSTC